MTTTRRQFLREIGYGALTSTALLTGAQHLLAINALAAPASTDYKALVCVFMFGGNDANNTVISLEGYADYAAARGALSISKELHLPINVPSHDPQTQALYVNGT